MGLTQLELNAKFNREQQSLPAPQKQERMELYAKHHAEQEAFEEAKKGAANEQQVEQNLVIERRVDELRPLDPNSAAGHFVRRERNSFGATCAASCAAMVADLAGEGPAPSGVHGCRSNT